ncbi:MAG: leucyl aminopeptidase [Pseudonocardiales bacterium]|nr:leucyl aminopeptidase [Pseudonocardiales bacterium]
MVGTVPVVPTPLLVVLASARPDDRAEHVVLLDTDGNQHLPRPATAEVDGADVDLSEVEPTVLERLGATGKAGEVYALPDGRWLLGVGDGSDLAGLRKAGATLAGALRSRAERSRSARSGSAQSRSGSGSDEPPPKRPETSPGPEYEQQPETRPVALGVAELSGSGREALVVGLILGSHQYRVSHRQPPLPGQAELVVPEAALPELRRQLEVAGTLAGATALARDLASTPSDVKTPTWLVETAAELAAEVPGLTAEVWPVERLRAEGFGGLLAVGGGSSRPPALLRLGWAPAGAPLADNRHLVLVGKGITFDTGGISIKPADGMHLMRTDMAAGGAVIAAMLAIARLGVPLRVTGLVPAAENHVSGSAYRPGDIVRHYDGTTTEVVNTDAEGRMVLADALGYAVRELAPDLIVDAATLTGAMKVALGMRTAGLFASDDELADAVLAAGDRAGERLWRMPLLDHVADEVDSTIADVRQAPPGPPGISAALFLRRFTGGVPWVHLDIAGPARCDKPYDEVAAGATGFVARTLVELALGLATPS